MVNVRLNDASLSMELDTEASRSIISEEEFCRLWPGKDRPVLTPCDCRLKTYSGEILPVCGQVMVSVAYEGQGAQLPLIVVKGKGPSLFGRNWLMQVQ